MKRWYLTPGEIFTMKKIASYTTKVELLLLLLLCDFQMGITRGNDKMGSVFGTEKCPLEWSFFVEWGIIIIINDHLGSLSTGFQTVKPF
jgi:hypothetical protein